MQKDNKVFFAYNTSWNNLWRELQERVSEYLDSVFSQFSTIKTLKVYIYFYQVVNFYIKVS